MSKIGNKPVEVPENVNVSITDINEIKIANGSNEIKIAVPKSLQLSFTDKKVIVKRQSEDKKTKALHGLYRSLIANAVAGVVKPWEKRLEIVGTGYNVKMQGEDLVFKIGYSHPVVFNKVQGIQYKVEGNNKIVVAGIDKQLVGQIAYQIKIIKKPDPYKGKGIRYQGEILKLKPGKKAKTEAG